MTLVYNCLFSLVSNPDQTSYYHCWVGIVASVPLLYNSLRSRSCCLVGNKSDSFGKYYSSPSCTAIMHCS